MRLGKIKILVTRGLCAVTCLTAAAAAHSAPVTLSFEGLMDSEPVASFYDGGFGGFGSGPGPSDGVVFGADSLALVAAADGGTGVFSNAPSGDTVVFFLTGPGDVIDVAGGFSTSLAFSYASSVPGQVAVYSGLDGAGSELASIGLAPTSASYDTFATAGATFTGVAQSIVFSGAADYIGFDDITLGAPSVISGAPEPSAWSLLIAGVGLIGAALRRPRLQISSV